MQRSRLVLVWPVWMISLKLGALDLAAMNPAFAVIAPLVLSTIAIIVSVSVPAWQQKRQHRNQKRLESWKGHVQELREARKQAVDLRDSLDSKIGQGILTREDTKTLEVMGAIKGIVKILRPLIDRDRGLDQRMAIMLMQAGNIDVLTPPSRDDLQYAVSRVLAGRRSQAESESEINVGPIYAWIAEFAHECLRQRDLVKDMISNLDVLNSDLLRRIDAS